MKKILRVVAITSTVMVVILGAFLWNMNRLSKQKAAKQEKLLAQERDLLPDSRQKAIDKVEKVNIKQLYLSGNNKNVVTVPSTGLQQVYDGSQSTKAEEMLTTVKKNKQFSFDKPLWAYNPYGTNSQSMYLYFKSDGKGYCRYTVSVDDRNIADFTRTPFNGGAENITKEHEYQIIGLLPGRVNYITVNFYSPKSYRRREHGRSHFRQMIAVWQGACQLKKVIANRRSVMGCMWFLQMAGKVKMERNIMRLPCMTIPVYCVLIFQRMAM